MITGSVIMLLVTDPNAALPSMIAGANSALTLCITMLSIYCVWLSVLKILERTKLTDKITKLLAPLTKRLFKGESDEARAYISMNLSANLFGMGGAATPMGIKAIESMQKRKDGKASDNMILFTVINCTSIQLFPATIIGLRLAGGSVSASDIILPSLLATAISTIVGIILCKVFKKS